MPLLSRRASREAALVELQRLHAAIQASRAKRGVLVEPTRAITPEAMATQALTRRLQADGSGLPPRAKTGRSRRLLWGLAGAAVIGGLGAWGWLAMRPTTGNETAYLPPVDTRPQPPPSAAPAPAPEPVATPPIEAAPAPPMRITLDTIRPVWMRVMVDGTRALEREVAAGEHLTFDASARIVVRAGDGGGVRASMNGVDRGPLGRDGWPITVPFAPDAAPDATSPPPE